MKNNKALLKTLLYITLIIISILLILYLSFTNEINLNNIPLFFGTVAIGIVSQILIMKLLYLDTKSYFNTHILFPALAAGESISAILCSYRGNGLLGTTLLISTYVVWTLFKKLKENSERKKKIKNYEKLINYINSNYNDAEIYKKDFNGKSIKFYLIRDNVRKSYRVFIDDEGNITDMFLLLKEKQIDY